MQEGKSDSKEGPDHRDHEGGEIVGDLDALAEGEVDAYAEDEHVANEREAGQRCIVHQRADERGHNGHQALPDGHWDDGEDRPLAHGGRQRHDNDHVEDALGGEDGVVVIQRIVHRTDDRHRADAQREGRGGEALDEERIALGMALDLQPLAEALQILLDGEDLADQAAQAHGDNQQHFAPRAERAAGDDEHLLERACGADEDGTQAASLDHDVLIAVLQGLAEQEAEQTAGEHECGIDDGTQSDHNDASFLHVDQQIVICFTRRSQRMKLL